MIEENNGLGNYKGKVYFDLTVIEGESLLKTVVGISHIEKSTRYIENLAISLGVKVDEITNPIPMKIQELAECYTFMEAAKKKSKMNASGSSEGADAYELKRRVYAAEVDKLTKEITANDFLANKSSTAWEFPFTMPLYRG